MRHYFFVFLTGLTGGRGWAGLTAEQEAGLTTGWEWAGLMAGRGWAGLMVAQFGLERVDY